MRVNVYDVGDPRDPHILRAYVEGKVLPATLFHVEHLQKTSNPAETVVENE